MNPDIEQVKKIIANSGNNLHCKVLRYFQDKNWTVLISPYYNDNMSDKPREIDLIAEKAFDVTDRHDKPDGFLNIRLFIECKFIPQKTVFWFHSKDRMRAEELIINNTPLYKDNDYTQQHHYLYQKYDHVAKLFDTETKRKAEGEIIYKAINQSLNAMVYYRNSRTLIPASPGRETEALSTLCYPVIVCNGFNNLYRVDIDTGNEPTNIKDNFQLEVNYAYLDSSKNPVTEYFLIDVVSLDRIDTLMDSLEKDARVVKIILR